MKRIEKYTTRLLLVLAFLFFANQLTAQNLKTVNDGYYDLEVVKSFPSHIEKVHVKRLTKKLTKKGFTNVQITILGSVQPKPNKPGSVSVAVAQLRNGANVETAISTATNEVDTSKFQVNFTSDQGEFKVRLGMMVNIRYIIGQ